MPENNNVLDEISSLENQKQEKLLSLKNNIPTYKELKESQTSGISEEAAMDQDMSLVEAALAELFGKSKEPFSLLELPGLNLEDLRKVVPSDKPQIFYREVYDKRGKLTNEVALTIIMPSKPPVDAQPEESVPVICIHVNKTSSHEVVFDPDNTHDVLTNLEILKADTASYLNYDAHKKSVKWYDRFGVERMGMKNYEQRGRNVAASVRKGDINLLDAPLSMADCAYIFGDCRSDDFEGLVKKVTGEDISAPWKRLQNQVEGVARVRAEIGHTAMLEQIKDSFGERSYALSQELTMLSQKRAELLAQEHLEDLKRAEELLSMFTLEERVAFGKEDLIDALGNLSLDEKEVSDLVEKYLTAEQVVPSKEEKFAELNISLLQKAVRNALIGIENKSPEEATRLLELLTVRDADLPEIVAFKKKTLKEIQERADVKDKYLSLRTDLKGIEAAANMKDFASLSAALRLARDMKKQVPPIQIVTTIGREIDSVISKISKQLAVIYEDLQLSSSSTGA